MEEFVSIRNYINENQSQENRYGCVMLFANVPDWDKLVKRIVKEEDVYDDPQEPGEYGYEENPHITVIYGLHHDEIVDQGVVYNIIQETPSITSSIKEIDIFENDDRPYDVVKFNIKPTQTLLNKRDEFLEMPNTQTFPEYHPHCTIAYVKKGEGKKYKRLLKDPIKIKFDKGVYSDPDYRKSYFDLKSKKYSK